MDHQVGESEGPDKKHGKEPVAGVSLRPNDPFAKKLSSTGVKTQNLLIKVTLPKRTGRKRKRGSNEPYEQTSVGEKDIDKTTASDLVRRMRDNADQYTLEPVGIISDTHRFQTLPDFQVRASEVPMMRELREHVMTPNYERLKAFNANVDALSDGMSTFPGPPNFAQNSNATPENRSGRWRSEKSGRDETIVKLMGGPTPPRLPDLGIPIDEQEVPQAPPKNLPEATSLPVLRAIEALQQLLEERPIVTRRVYTTRLQGHTEPTIRWAMPYVAYYLNYGPWRHAIVKYGVDPRKDPKYRIYQTLSFSHKAVKSIKSVFIARKKAEAAYTFDGKTMADPASMWQLCDLTDPLLQSLVNTNDIRSKCDSTGWGWYQNGTVAKICVIMRDKMIRLAKQERVMSEDKYAILANLPNEVRRASECYLDQTQYGRHISQLAEAIGDEAVTGTVTKFRGYEVMVPVELDETPRVEDAGEGVDENAVEQASEEVEAGADFFEQAVDAMPEDGRE